MQKKVPYRRCCGCGEMKPKRELMRVVRKPDGSVEIDLTGKVSGRGAYVCKNTECFKKSVKNGGLARTLQISIPEEVYTALKEKLENEQQ